MASMDKNDTIALPVLSYFETEDPLATELDEDVGQKNNGGLRLPRRSVSEDDQRQI